MDEWGVAGRGERACHADRVPDSREVLTRPAPPPDVTLSYGPGPYHVIDVRLPPSSPAGLIVMLHGGFWREEYDRTHTGPMTSALAAAGYVVATPEFRRTGGGGGWPGTFDDVAAALDAAPGLLAPYSSSPPVLVGNSAGGHLALWAATRLGARARSVVSLAGCADLALCSRLGLDDGAMSFTARFAAVGSEPEMVRRAWDLDVVAARYAGFVAAFGEMSPVGAHETMLAQTRLVHEWRRFPFLDPRLPAELLPADWIGDRARELFTRRHAEWAEAAQRRWRELVGH